MFVYLTRKCWLASNMPSVAHEQGEQLEELSQVTAGVEVYAGAMSQLQETVDVGFSVSCCIYLITCFVSMVFC